MYAEERQQEIVRRARAEGRVDVVALAETFGVTAETIRRDLTVLERSGVLRRVHGGAIPVERLGFEPALAAPGLSMAAAFAGGDLAGGLLIGLDQLATHAGKR